MLRRLITIAIIVATLGAWNARAAEGTGTGGAGFGMGSLGFGAAAVMMMNMPVSRILLYAATYSVFPFVQRIFNSFYEATLSPGLEVITNRWQPPYFHSIAPRVIPNPHHRIADLIFDEVTHVKVMAYAMEFRRAVVHHKPLPSVLFFGDAGSGKTSLLEGLTNEVGDIVAFYRHSGPSLADKSRTQIEHLFEWISERRYDGFWEGLHGSMKAPCEAGYLPTVLCTPLEPFPVPRINFLIIDEGEEPFSNNGGVEVRDKTLSAILARTSLPSENFALGVATQRVGKFDPAMFGRFLVSVGIFDPARNERFRILKFYLDKHMKNYRIDMNVTLRYDGMIERALDHTTAPENVNATDTDSGADDSPATLEQLSAGMSARDLSAVAQMVVADAHLFREGEVRLDRLEMFLKERAKERKYVDEARERERARRERELMVHSRAMQSQATTVKTTDGRLW